MTRVRGDFPSIPRDPKKVHPTPTTSLWNRHEPLHTFWFDDEAEEAARFYVGTFPNSRVLRVTRYGKEGHDLHGRPEGSVMTVDFELDGMPFTALNGGNLFTF